MYTHAIDPTPRALLQPWRGLRPARPLARHDRVRRGRPGVVATAAIGRRWTGTARRPRRLPVRRVRTRGRRTWRRAQGAARGHPHRGAAAARRGAAQRLPDHAGGAGAQRRRLAPEPRLGLPRPAAARGRGPDPLRGARRAQGLPAHRRRPRPRRGARSRAARPLGADERRRRREGPRARQDHARGRLRLRAGHARRQRGAAGAGPQGARHRASRAVSHPRRRRRARGVESR